MDDFSSLEELQNPDVVTIIRYASGEIVVDHDLHIDVALSLLAQAQYLAVREMFGEECSD